MRVNRTIRRSLIRVKITRKTEAIKTMKFKNVKNYENKKH